MKIRFRLTIYFTLLVAGILTFSSISVYFFSKARRDQDFFLRLRSQAISTAVLLFNVKEINAQLLKTIDDNIRNPLSDAKVWVLDDKKKILYSNTDSISSVNILPEFSYMRWQDGNFRKKDQSMYLCLLHEFEGKDYFVLAMSSDLVGSTELKNLKLILSLVLGISMVLTFLAGYINAWNSLKPIKEVIDQVDAMKASDLGKRLKTDSKDEIAELARTFNKLIERIERAFETERMFVSNASHELRTPITAIKGQIEIALSKKRTEEEYRKLLQSIQEDINNMAILVNGFLELAESNIEPGRVIMEKVRLDELIFSVKEDFNKRRPEFVIMLEFENIPEEENHITIKGNLGLLKILVSNLVDNACKFSTNKKALLKIGFTNKKVWLKVIDNGIGIPSDEIESVFLPLYRSKNAGAMQGSGIGLSIVNRVASLHNAEIKVNSELHIGTTVMVSFPVYIS